MPFYGQPWFLSILSGLVAVLLFHFLAAHPPSDTAPVESDASADSGWGKVFRNGNAKTYLGVFLVVAVLVYGSFLVAESTGNCRFIDIQPDIQTGGRPPF